MRRSEASALARCVSDLTDALDPDKPDTGLADVASDVRDTLDLLIQRSEDHEAQERFESGARVKVKMGRGDSPRDSDTWTIEGKGRDHEEAAAQFDELLDEYQRRWADRVRGVDPYDD